MLNIGNVYLQHIDGQTRLCADIALNGKGTTLWFGVKDSQEAYLCADRSDAFVMALLPTAMRGGYRIVCQTPMSERLHYQLENYLIPSLCAAGQLYHPVTIEAPLTAQRVESLGGVATGFSGGVDSLYTIMTHGKDSAYPLTHLALFNVGVFEGANFREGFGRACSKAQIFAEEMGLELVGLDSNISQVLPERFLDVYSFRNLAGAMALQNVFGVYLLSSGHDVASFTFDLRNTATYDLLTVNCAQTESLRVYLSGTQVTRDEKLKYLADWEPAHHWLHPCFRSRLGEKNCGNCKKCVRDLTALYAYGLLDRFERVFDIPAFKREIPKKIGFILANREDHLYDEAWELLKNSGADIPSAAYVYEKQFRISMERLREKQK